MNESKKGKSQSKTLYEPRMESNKPGSLNLKRTILLSLSFFTVLMAWMYFNFKVPLILDDLLSKTNISAVQTLKGLIMAIDNLIAVLVQPYFGNLSDRTKSKFGRRMPFIIVGTILSAIFFSIIPVFGILGNQIENPTQNSTKITQLIVGLVIIILLFDISMSTFRSVSIAILPDYTPDEVRSKGSAIQQFIANLGGVMAFGIPIFLGLFTFKEGSPWGDLLGFLIVSVAMILALIVQLLKIKETPTGDKFFELNSVPFDIDPVDFKVTEKREIKEEKVDKEEEETVLSVLKEIFTAEDKSFRNMLFVVFFAYSGFAAIEAFFSSFATIYMGKAESVAGTLFLAYSVPMILTAYFWGLLGQKIGRKKAARFGLFGIIIGATLFVAFVVPNVYNPIPESEDFLDRWDYIVMMNLALVSMSWMCFIVNSFPIVWALSPKGKTGTYTGIYYTFNQFAYTLAPILAGLNLDYIATSGTAQYIALFPMVLVLIIISFIFMLRVKSGDKQLSEEKITEFNEKFKEID